MATITEIRVELPMLVLFEDVAECGDDVLPDSLDGLGFNVTIPPDVGFAPLALGGRVIGVVVGKVEGDGIRAARQAFERY